MIVASAGFSEIHLPNACVIFHNGPLGHIIYNALRKAPLRLTRNSESADLFSKIKALRMISVALRIVLLE